MRYLPEAIDDLDLVNAMDAGTQPSVHTEDLIVYHYTQCKEVKHVGEVMPDVRISVLAVAFSIETVGLSDTTRFVVASDEVNSLRIAKLEADKEGDRLDREKTPIHVVACQHLAQCAFI